MDRFDVWKLVLDAGGAFMFVFSSIILTTCQDKIAEDRETHGSMFVTVILGSNKTMVSVATGHNEFYPLYASLGNVHNSVWCAHRNAVSLVGFLAMPKSMCLVMFSLSWIICPIASFLIVLTFRSFVASSSIPLLSTFCHLCDHLWWNLILLNVVMDIGDV